MLPDLSSLLYLVVGILCGGVLYRWLITPAVQPVAETNTTNSEVTISESDLLVATKAGDLKKMKFLIESDPSIVQEEQASCTLTAVEENQLAALELLLENGACPDCHYAPSNTTLLIAAARNKQEAMVTLLLKHGAKVNTSNAVGDTALIWACSKGLVQTVKELLDAGANPNHKNKDGNSALDIIRSNKATISALITTYQNGGPSWLARELSAQGLSWSVVCDVEAKLVKEGFVSQSAMASTPLTKFTDCYLSKIGITELGVQQMVCDIRLRSTWLGARLSAMSVDSTNMTACENSIFHIYNCTTKEQFAALLPSDLIAVPMVTARNVDTILLELHRQVCEELGITNTDSTGTTMTTTPTVLSVIAPITGSTTATTTDPTNTSSPTTTNTVISTATADTIVSDQKDEVPTEVEVEEEEVQTSTVPSADTLITTSDSTVTNVTAATIGSTGVQVNNSTTIVVAVGSVVSSASDVSTTCAEMEVKEGMKVVDVGDSVGSDSSSVSVSDDDNNINTRDSVTVSSTDSVDSVDSWEQL